MMALLGVLQILKQPLSILKSFENVHLNLTLYLSSVQFSSVTQLCLTLCDPMDCSIPSFPVHHQLTELTQTHVHRVADAIQPSHPLSSPSPPAFNHNSNRVFSNESVLHIRWPRYWSFSFSISPSNEYSRLISFRIYWLGLLAVQGILGRDNKVSNVRLVFCLSVSSLRN